MSLRAFKPLPCWKVKTGFLKCIWCKWRKGLHIYNLKLYGLLQGVCVCVWYFCLNIWFLFSLTFSQMAAVLLTFCNPMMYIEQIFVLRLCHYDLSVWTQIVFVLYVSGCTNGDCFFFCLIRMCEILAHDCHIKKWTRWRLDLPLNLTLFPIYLYYFHFYPFDL